MNNGAFVISLDFELCWGLIATQGVEKYKENFINEKSTISNLLELFDRYGTHVTWATVGFLFFRSKKDLLDALPDRRPSYQNKKLSSYEEIKNVGVDEEHDVYHLAPSLISLIASYKNQEIATHTFSHYYCMEEGHSKETFREDLKAALEIAKKSNFIIKSIVFPQNQINNQYLSLCKDLGIESYRGVGPSWIYKSRTINASYSLPLRIARLFDSYINISGFGAYSVLGTSEQVPINIPASRFLKPYNKRLKVFEPLRLHRILTGLTYAAKNNLVYHLWWHPHNFGKDTKENMDFLKKILDHVALLQKKYDMKNYTMAEAAALVD